MRSYSPNEALHKTSLLGNEEIKRYNLKLLDKDEILYSSSPRGLAIMLVLKKDGTWKIYVEYQLLNIITIKN
jgi:hypothetical protein